MCCSAVHNLEYHAAAETIIDHDANENALSKKRTIEQSKQNRTKVAFLSLSGLP